MTNPRSATGRFRSFRAAVGGLLARRTVIAAVAVVWLGLTGVLTVTTSPGAATLLGLVATGMIVVGIMQSHRHHRTVLAMLRSQAGVAEMRRGIGEILDRLKLTSLSLGRLSEDLADHTNSVGWTAPPELVLTMVDTLRIYRPSLVVVAGGGAPVIWCALAARHFAIDARVVAFEHDPMLARETRNLLIAHGISHVAEVRDAPLGSLDVDHRAPRWNSDAWMDLKDIDLLILGNGSSESQAALFALPALGDRLREDAAIMISGRLLPDESHRIEQWLADAAPLADHDSAPATRVQVLRRRPRPRQPTPQTQAAGRPPTVS